MKTLSLKTQRGFSLIEVIVAMGIASTVMVGLIGIMPAGVESLHDASTTTIQARIVQDLISDAQMSDWDVRPVGNNGEDKSYLTDLAGMANSRKYDSEGNLIAGGKNAAAATSYATLLELPTGADLNPTVLSTTYKHLKKVLITVEFTPGGRAPDFNANGPRARFIKKYSFYIANMGTTQSIDHN